MAQLRSISFYFADEAPPAGVVAVPVLISGDDTAALPGAAYLVVQHEGRTSVFEIRCAYHVSAFKAAMMVGDTLVVGHEAHCYIYDTALRVLRLKLEMQGYFGHLYFHDDRFYATDAWGMFCFDAAGNVAWENHQLGVDGVLIDTFSDKHIKGDGEWDPPGGWRSFVLDRETGEII